MSGHARELASAAVRDDTNATVRSPLAPHIRTPAESKQLQDAEAAGMPFVVYRDGADHQRIRELAPTETHASVGRSPQCAIALEWDEGVSWVHAELRRIGDGWVIRDAALSRNGTFVDGSRVQGDQLLKHGNLLRAGSTLLAFQDPASLPVRPPTTVQVGSPPVLSEAQGRVLLELCRPYAESGRLYPPSNDEIADALVLEKVTVKTHLREMFKLFDLTDLKPTQKRAALVVRAFETGAVTVYDYTEH
jgi:pSer/pThr/pTyr-binding forkhead associated (FHA) protein